MLRTFHNLLCLGAHRCPCASRLLSQSTASRLSTVRGIASGLLTAPHSSPFCFTQRTIFAVTQRFAHSDAAAVEHDGSSQEKPTATEMLQQLNPVDEKRLKVLQLEYDVWISTGGRYPENVTDEMWATLLLECPTLSSRRSKYKFWFLKERAIAKQDRKKAERLIVHRQRKQEQDKLRVDGFLPLLNVYMMFVREATMNKHYYNNLAYAMAYGQTLVFDCSFEDQMKERELINLAEQINYCHGMNKVAKDPFHFHFCNLNSRSYFRKKLDQFLPGIENMPVSVSSENYTEIYPRERLVYLTPNSNNVLDTFDHDDIYIIGSIVDKSIVKPFTFAKAKSENIRTAKLPLDNYLL